MANSNPFLYPSLENPFLYKENPFLEKCSSPNLDQTLGIFIPFPAEDIPADFKTSWNVSHPELENIEDDFLVETTGSTLQTILVSWTYFAPCVIHSSKNSLLSQWFQMASRGVQENFEHNIETISDWALLTILVILYIFKKKR